MPRCTCGAVRMHYSIDVMHTFREKSLTLQTPMLLSRPSITTAYHLLLPICSTTSHLLQSSEDYFREPTKAISIQFQLNTSVGLAHTRPNYRCERSSSSFIAKVLALVFHCVLVTAVHTRAVMKVFRLMQPQWFFLEPAWPRLHCTWPMWQFISLMTPNHHPLHPPPSLCLLSLDL